ncbi:unnamed protein product [Litomosoides sigmodontis]|uniref:Uncharacterized protein n=1 Tax=Litomosoides sigmodontis TaxID=42156 RepID=A0A3P6U0N2_LITSI|nr:unnamed protein product [Litomosoides sigmodontis]
MSIASDNSSASTVATSMNSQTIYGTTSTANRNTQCDFEFSRKFEEWLKTIEESEHNNGDEALWKRCDQSDNFGLSPRLIDSNKRPLTSLILTFCHY